MKYVLIMLKLSTSSLLRNTVVNYTDFAAMKLQLADTEKELDSTSH